MESSREGSIYYYHFWLGSARCCTSCPIKFQDFLTIKIHAWNQIIPSIFWMDIILRKGRTWDYNLDDTCWISCPIRLQYSFIKNISKNIDSYLIFSCMELVIKGWSQVRLPLLVGCGQLSISSNQVVGFFDHQFF